MNYAIIFSLVLGLWFTGGVEATRGSSKIKIFAKPRKTVNRSDRDRAIATAKLSALQNFVEQELELPDKNAFYEQEAKITANIEKYILNTKVLNENYNRSMKTFSILVNLQFSRDRLLKAIRHQVVRRSDGKTRHALSSRLVALYFVRKISKTNHRTVKTKDVRKSRVTERGYDDEEVTNPGVAFSSQTNRKAESGHYSKKITESSLDLCRNKKPTTLQSTINEAFSNHGFKTIAPGGRRLKRKSNNIYDYKSYMKEWICEFVSQRDDCGFEDMKEDIKDGLREAGIQFVSFATLSIYQETEDEDSGLPSIDIRAESEIFDLRNEWPEQIAGATANTNGVGRDYNSARDSALHSLGKSVVDKLVSQLAGKGIKF